MTTPTEALTDLQDVAAYLRDSCQSPLMANVCDRALAALAQPPAPQSEALKLALPALMESLRRCRRRHGEVGTRDVDVTAWNASIDAAIAQAGDARAAFAQAEQPKTFQARVQPWLLACFGAEIAADKSERNHRFLEESLELVQACGCTESEAHQLVAYVYGRPVGDPPQEVGGVMVTLAALCLAQGMDMHAAGETELARIWTMVEKIRAKQAAKPKHSPLPQAEQPAEQAQPTPTDKHDPWAVLGRFFKTWVQSALYDGGGSEVDLEEPYEAFRSIQAQQTIAAPPAAPPVAPKGEAPTEPAIEVLRDLAQVCTEVRDHTPQSWERAVLRIGNRATVLLRAAPPAARPQPQPLTDEQRVAVETVLYHYGDDERVEPLRGLL